VSGIIREKKERKGRNRTGRRIWLKKTGRPIKIAGRKSEENPRKEANWQNAVKRKTEEIQWVIAKRGNTEDMDR